MGDLEKAKEYLRTNMLPKLSMILEFADEVISESRKEGEFDEKPSSAERFMVAQLITTMMAQSAMTAAAQAGQAEAGTVPVTLVDYRKIEGPFKNILADDGIDMEAWAHLEELLTQTGEGQAMLSALVGMAHEHNKAEGAAADQG